VTSGIIVISAIVFGVVFSLAWLLRPTLRERIERPKHGFQASVRRYDQSFQDTADGEEDRNPR
jgi:hypothetical protein